jgi:hypothetical protein
MSVPPENHRTRADAATKQQPSLHMAVHRDIPPAPSAPANVAPGDLIKAAPIRASIPGTQRPKADQETINRLALEMAERTFADGGRKLKKRPVLEKLLRDEVKAMGLRWERDQQLDIAYGELPDHLKMRHGGQTKSQNEEPKDSE